MKKILPIVLLVTATLILTGYVLSKTRVPKEPVPSDSTTTPAIYQQDQIQMLLAGWPLLSKQITLSPANGSWFISAIQLIASSTVLVSFEDGHDAHTAVVDLASSHIKTVYQSKTRFAKNEWKNIVASYGAPAYVPATYVRSIVRGTKLVAFDQFTKVPENVFVR
jgi:hypothetical protein